LAQDRALVQVALQDCNPSALVTERVDDGTADARAGADNQSALALE
jgi:hypothetical protein